VVKHVDAVELRVVAAAVLAIAADALLVAHHLLTLGAHLVTALARLNMYNSAQRSSLESGGTGNRKYRLRARVYPELENEVGLPIQPIEL
jgi:hypothetical protein